MVMLSLRMKGIDSKAKGLYLKMAGSHGPGHGHGRGRGRGHGHGRRHGRVFIEK